MAGSSKKYQDLRYLFMRGLIDHERSQRCRHYLKSAAECTSRAIVSLELADEPIKSIKQARRLEGIGGETCNRLTKLDKERDYSCVRPLAGRFVSSAGGILVGLLDATEEAVYKGHKGDKDVLIPETSVRTRAVRLTEEMFNENEAEFCKAWWRLEVLIKRGFIKRRTQKKLPVLQLLPFGKDTALLLREKNGLTSTVPAVPKAETHDMCTHLPTLPDLPWDTTPHKPVTSTVNSLEVETLEEATQKGTPNELVDALYTNDTGQDGVVMLVDRREMGGEKHGLAELCRQIEGRGIVYQTRHLHVGDYSWVWRVRGHMITLPCLVERKRADDIARTLKEGRFWSQVKKMVEWRRGFKDVDCAIHYVLEHKPEEFVVKCEDGCQGIVQCGYPTLTQVKNVIEDLKKHPDLLVKQTDNLSITVIVLASITTELVDRVKKGEYEHLLQQELSDPDCSKSNIQSNTSSRTVPHKHSNTSTNSEAVGTDDIDADLRMVLEKSKMEAMSSPIICDNEVSENEDLRMALKLSNRETTRTCQILDTDEIRMFDLTADEEEDEELKLVLERSLYETRGPGSVKVSGGHQSRDFSGNKGSSYTYNKMEEPECKIWSNSFITKDLTNDVKSGEHKFNDTLTHPLVQYHCTEGSVNYPSTSRTSLGMTVDTDVYKPKMNKTRVLHQSPLKSDKTRVLHQSPLKSDKTRVLHQSPLKINKTQVLHQSPLKSDKTRVLHQSPLKSDKRRHEDNDKGDTYYTHSVGPRPHHEIGLKKVCWESDRKKREFGYHGVHDDEGGRIKRSNAVGAKYQKIQKDIETNAFQASNSTGMTDSRMHDKFNCMINDNSDVSDHENTDKQIEYDSDEDLFADYDHTKDSTKVSMSKLESPDGKLQNKPETRGKTRDSDSWLTKLKYISDDQNSFTEDNITSEKQERTVKDEWFINNSEESLPDLDLDYVTHSRKTAPKARTDILRNDVSHSLVKIQEQKSEVPIVNRGKHMYRSEKANIARVQKDSGYNSETHPDNMKHVAVRNHTGLVGNQSRDKYIHGLGQDNGNNGTDRTVLSKFELGDLSKIERNSNVQDCQTKSTARKYVRKSVQAEFNERNSGLLEDKIDDGESESSAAVEMVVAVLPHISSDLARTALVRCGNSVEQCITHLLENPPSSDTIDLTDSQPV